MKKQAMSCGVFAMSTVTSKVSALGYLTIVATSVAENLFPLLLSGIALASSLLLFALGISTCLKPTDEDGRVTGILMIMFALVAGLAAVVFDIFYFLNLF